MNSNQTYPLKLAAVLALMLLVAHGFIQTAVAAPHITWGPGPAASARHRDT
jgi:hypothetical protein